MGQECCLKMLCICPSALQTEPLLRPMRRGALSWSTAFAAAAVWDVWLPLWVVIKVTQGGDTRRDKGLKSKDRWKRRRQRQHKKCKHSQEQTQQTTHGRQDLLEGTANTSSGVVLFIWIHFSSWFCPPQVCWHFFYLQSIKPISSLIHMQVHTCNKNQETIKLCG